MSDTSNFGFGKFVPGFDFLQSLAKGASSSIPQLPNLSNWVAPTISVEELEKRIDELKAVQFWLEQNSRALTATVRRWRCKDDAGHAQGHELQHGRRGQRLQAQACRRRDGQHAKAAETLLRAGCNCCSNPAPAAAAPAPAEPVKPPGRTGRRFKAPAPEPSVATPCIGGAR